MIFSRISSPFWKVVVTASFQAELRSESGDFRLNLVVNSVGRIILCSVDGHAVPGYALCPSTSSDAEA